MQGWKNATHTSKIMAMEVEQYYHPNPEIVLIIGEIIILFEH